MRRTARSPRSLFGALALAWALAIGEGAYAALRPDDHPVAAALFLVLLSGLVLWATLYLAVTRAAMDPQGIELRALRKRHRLRASLDAVVGYHMDKDGAWWVHTRPEGTRFTEPAGRTRVAVLHPWELHRAFVELAPRRLGGRKMRFPGVPPEEEFRGMWVYDVERLVSQASGTIAAVLLLTLVFRRFSWGGFGQLMGLFVGPALEAWERIDVTREGIVRRSPFRRREIRWADAKAIFREGSKDKRSFVIVGPDAAIHLPSHLAIDRDLIEKVLYSLPDPILCVNFDETTLRGYKRRKEAKEPVRGEDLLLATT